jgi:hypothetical protein
MEIQILSLNQLIQYRKKWKEDVEELDPYNNTDKYEESLHRIRVITARVFCNRTLGLQVLHLCVNDAAYHIRHYSFKERHKTPFCSKTSII